MTTLSMWPIAQSPMCPFPQGVPSLSSILTMIPICLHFLLPMCPIAHVPHHPCAPYSNVPHLYLQYQPRYPFTHVAHCPYVKMLQRCQVVSKIFVKIHAVLKELCPCDPLPMCPITHVPHYPCMTSSMCPIPQGASSVSTKIPLCPCGPLPMCPIAHVLKCLKDVKLSKRCQVVKKMSNVKKSNTWTMEEVHKKINSHNEVHTY